MVKIKKRGEIQSISFWCKVFFRFKYITIEKRLYSTIVNRLNKVNVKFAALFSNNKSFKNA